MTNKNSPFGARIFNIITSAKFDLRINKYTVADTDSTPIFINDFVKSTGKSDEEGIPIVTKVTSPDDSILGIVNNVEPIISENTALYRLENTKRILHVCDDPFVKFEIQVNGDFSVNDVIKNANLAIGSGETVTGLSTTQLDYSSITTGNAQLKILGLIERPTNSLGQNAKVACVIIRHELAPYESSAFWELELNNLQPIVDGHDINSRSGNFYGNNDKFNSEDKTLSGSFNTTLTTTHSCGLISGGEIKVKTPLPSTIIDTSGGRGYFRKTDSDSGELVESSWPELLNQNIPIGEVRYIGVTYNGGSPIIVLKTSDTWNNHTEFRFGSVVNEQNTLHILNNPWRAIDPISFINERFYETKPFERADRTGGIKLGETGTRNVTVSEGELYDITNEFPIRNLDTSISDIFDSYLGQTQSSSGITQWDNLNYNNGGVLTPLTTNWYANLWWYIEADSNIVMLYGTAQYATPAGAEGEGAPSVIPLRIKTHGRLIGRFIFREGESTALLIESAFEEDFAGTTTGSHSNLSNLGYGASKHTRGGFGGFQQGTTSSTSNPTVNDDEAKGYFIGDLWANTLTQDSYVLYDKTTGAAVWKKFTSQKYTTDYFVAKSGSDSNTGLSDDDPFLTPQAATAAGGAGPYVINILDNGTYTGVINLKGLISFPSAKIIGKIIFESNLSGIIKGFYLKNDVYTTTDAMESGAFSGEYIFNVDIVHIDAAFAAVKQSVATNRGIGTIKKVILEHPLNINTVAVYVTNGLFPTPCNIEIMEVQIIGTGTGGTGLFYAAPTAHGVGKVKIGKITTAPTVSNTRGIFTSGTGAVEVSIDSGSCTTAYETADSSNLILIGNTNLQGNVIEGSSVPVIQKIGDISTTPSTASNQKILVHKGSRIANWEALNYVDHDRLENRTYTNYTSAALVTNWFLSNAVPAITEGVQINTKTYTPKKIGNVLKVTASYEVGIRPVGASREWGHIALFVQGVSSALTLKPKLYPALTEFDTYVETLVATAFLTVTSLTTLTFEVRAAINGFGLFDDLTINGNSYLGPRGGGTLLSFIDIEERG